jgi:hypothetical protein
MDDEMAELKAGLNNPQAVLEDMKWAIEYQATKRGLVKGSQRHIEFVMGFAPRKPEPFQLTDTYEDLVAVVEAYQGSGNPKDPAMSGEAQESFLDELVDAEGLESLPDPEPLIQGVLDKDTLNWLQGKPNHGKSLLALDIAACVASGKEWYGFKCEQGIVLYVVAEGSKGAKKRKTAWEIHNEQKMSPQVKFLPRNVRFKNQSDHAKLYRTVEQLQPVLIILDTQARVAAGIEENSNTQMGEFVEALDRLRLICGSAVLTVHHESRDGTNLRGGSVMEGAAETVLRIKKEADTRVIVSCEKQKDDAPFTDLLLEIKRAGPSVVLAKSSSFLPAVEFTEEQKDWARDWWNEIGMTEVSVSEAYTRTGISKAQFYRNVKPFLATGKIEKDEKTAKYRMMFLPTFD